jgi:hypothetical protein
VDGNPRGGTFLGAPIWSLADLPREEVYLVLIATFSSAEGVIGALTGLGIRREKIISLNGVSW